MDTLHLAPCTPGEIPCNLTCSSEVPLGMLMSCVQSEQPSFCIYMGTMVMALGCGLGSISFGAVHGVSLRG